MIKPKIFNADALNELRQFEELGQIGLIREVCTLFISSSSEYLSKLKYYGELKDPVNFGLNAHSMKSSAKVLGLEQIAQVCLELEVAARNQEIQTEKLLSLESILDKSCQALREFLTAEGR